MKQFILHKTVMRGSKSPAFNIIYNHDGFALVMVLLIAMISLALMSGLIYMVTSGTQVSGVQKRYNTSLEAGKSGGTDVTFQILSSRGNPYSAAEAALFNFAITASATCLTDKLNKATIDWDATCDSSLNLITSPTPNPATYDMAFQLGSSPTYSVYTKIVDTVEGNSSADEGLVKSGVVSSNTGEVQVMSIPYLYTIEIVSENSSNSIERAKLSILYQY